LAGSSGVTYEGYKVKEQDSKVFNASRVSALSNGKRENVSQFSAITMEGYKSLNEGQPSSLKSEGPRAQAEKRYQPLVSFFRDKSFLSLKSGFVPRTAPKVRPKNSASEFQGGYGASNAGRSDIKHQVYGLGIVILPIRNAQRLISTITARSSFVTSMMTRN